MKVFISYGSKEYSQASTLRTVIMNNGFDCWMAPESIPAGSNYASEISNAISSCDVFVLILSQSSQTSVFVKKGLDLALTKRKAIIPFHIDQSIITDWFEFRLANIKRIEAYLKLSEAYKELIKEIKESRIYDKAFAQ